MSDNKQPVNGGAQDTENRKEKFEQDMEVLLGKSADKQIAVWEDWVSECLDDEQYVDFVERPRDIAEKKWYEELLYSFKRVNDAYGKVVLEKVVAFADVPHALYPWEIMPAAQIVSSGGTPQDVIKECIGDGLPDDMEYLEHSRRCREIEMNQEINNTNKDEFWKIIAHNREQFGTNDAAFLNGIEDSLRKLAPAEIAQFKAIFDTYMQAAYIPGMWEASILIRMGSAGGDDSFIDFRAWLISRGRDAYYNAMADPDSMADLHLPEPDPYYSTPSYCELESFTYLPAIVYEKVTGEDLYKKMVPLSKYTTDQILSDVHIEPYMWEQHRDTDMPRLFPKLTQRADKFGYQMEPDCGWVRQIPRSEWGLQR